MKRIFLFMVTNLAVLALLSVMLFIVERVFGVNLERGGLGGLLIFAAIFGFGGSLISLAKNAFATGARRNAALAAVSSGLLRSMSRSQAEAILGHEITHVANGDMVTLALLQGVLNTFVIFLARIIGSMIDALQALKQSHGEPMPPQMQAFGINTGSTHGFMRLFMSYPPLDERIAALQTTG